MNDMTNDPTITPEHRPPVVGPDGGEQPSEERSRCYSCGAEGWRSDWPDHGGIVPDADGRPLCDACADEADEAD